MAFQPVEVDPEGLSDPLPHLHPRPGRGGQLDHVKNLWHCSCATPPSSGSPRQPVERSRPGIHSLRLVPGVGRGCCFPLRIQVKPTRGLNSSFVSSWKKNPRRGRAGAKQHFQDHLQSLALLLRVRWRRDGTGPAPDEAQPVESATHRLSADSYPAVAEENSCNANNRQLQRGRSQPQCQGWASSTRVSIWRWSSPARSVQVGGARVSPDRRRPLPPPRESDR